MTDEVAKAIAEAISVLAGLVFLSIVVSKLIDWFIKPVFTKFNWDTWWLTYVALVIGGLIGWATEMNAFALLIPKYIWLGRLLTSVACGGGPTLLFDIIDKGQPARLPMTPTEVKAKATDIADCADKECGTTGCGACCSSPD